MAIGNGDYSNIDEKVTVPSNLCTEVANAQECYYQKFIQILLKFTKSLRNSELVILTSKSDQMAPISNMALKLFKWEEMVYTSVDTVVSIEDDTYHLIKFLNSLKPGLSYHGLILHVDTPVML